MRRQPQDFQSEVLWLALFMRFFKEMVRDCAWAVYGCAAAYGVQDKIHATIQRLLTLLGMRTSTYNFDMRIDKDYNVYLMEVAPRDGGNYIPQAIRYATGIDLVECSVKAAMGEKIEIPEHIQPQGCWAYYAVHSLKDGILKQVVIDPEVERNHLVENHLIVKPGDEIHSFIGANSTLGILVMKFDSLEQMLDMIENADRWIQIEYSMTENYISENKGGGKE